MFNFNAQEYDPSGSFDPIPEGTYMAWVKTAELKPTKDGNGSMIVCQFEIIEQEQKGRIFFDRFNVHNPSTQAQEIGRKQLSALCYATGILRLTDPKQLIGIPVQVRLGIRAAEGQYQSQNVVREYRTQHGVKPQDLHSGRASSGTPIGAPNMAPVIPASKPQNTANQYAQPYVAPNAEAPQFATPMGANLTHVPPTTNPAYNITPPVQETQSTPTPPTGQPVFTPPTGARPAFTPPPEMAPKK